MNQNEIITARYTRTVPAGNYPPAITPLTKEISVATALAALNRIAGQPNTFRLEFEGQRIMSFGNTASGVIANGESGMWGKLWYSHPIDSSRDLAAFVQGLMVVQLFPNPDGNLSAMYPISIEAWLYE